MRRLVLEYYVVLDSILRDKPEVRHLLAWCRYCGIPFIRDPRNARRVDLGCPFGCADIHRRRESNKRSVRYNGSLKGKLKRYQREEERGTAANRSAVEVSKAREMPPATTVEETQDAASRSVEPHPRDRRADHPCPSPEVPQPTPNSTTTSAEAGADGLASRSSEDFCGPSPPGRGPSAGSVPAEPDRVEIAPRMLAYVRVVISLLEGRHIHREEILEMLARTKRQRSFAREKRNDYVLRRLSEESEKPP